MLQRVQTLFFLFAALCNAGLLMLPFWQVQQTDTLQRLNGLYMWEYDNNGTIIDQTLFMIDPMHIAVFASCVLASAFILMVIFFYKNRPRQMRLGYVGILLLLIEIGTIAFFILKGPYTSLPIEPEQAYFGLGLPLIAIILTWIGIKRVKKDEDLVRSVDRIR